MSKKPIKPHQSPGQKLHSNSSRSNLKLDFSGREGLGAYTTAPDAYDRVIHNDDTAVIIKDMFPKSSVHLLVLPKSSRNLLHPFEAFDDAEFLAQVKIEVEKAKQMVASELRRMYGRFSKSEQARIQARDSDDPPELLPEGRDWMKEIITGIHAVPSMTHLHVHVMSRDMVSSHMKRNNHYNSFCTKFLVPLDKFPLAPDDPLRRAGHGAWHSVDLICWRCKRDFGNKMAKLKLHLAEEHDQWKRE
jgi:aprataxin